MQVSPGSNPGSRFEAKMHKDYSKYKTVLPGLRIYPYSTDLCS